MEKTQIPTNPPPSAETEIPSYTPAACSSFASLVISKLDRIRLVSFPRTIVDTVQETIQSTWQRGIQNVREYNGSHEFKLRGWPWSTNTDESLLATRLIRRILAVLFTHGWVLSLSTDISQRQENKTALMFRHQHPAPNPCEWVAISFNSFNLLRLIDAPTSLVQTLVADLSLVTKSHQPHKLQDVYELKLYGDPWGTFGKDSMQAWKMALKLMETLEVHGFKVCSSINHKGRSQALEPDTWYCCRRIGWVPGAPVHDGE